MRVGTYATVAFPGLVKLDAADQRVGRGLAHRAERPRSCSTRPALPGSTAANVIRPAPTPPTSKSRLNLARAAAARQREIRVLLHRLCL